MQIDHFLERLDKIRLAQNGFDYKLGKALQLDDFVNIEKKHDIKIPGKIKDFYLVANGLKTLNPDFKLIELDSWIVKGGLIHFATFDNLVEIYFAISKPNDAKEWTIINKDNNYVIAKTITNLWSDKIWHWLEQKYEIWEDNWWVS